MFSSEGQVMLTEYIVAAMHWAQFQQREDGSWHGRVLGVQGVCAHRPSLEECREALCAALEELVLFGLVNGFPVPPIDGIDLVVAGAPPGGSAGQSATAR